MEIRFLLHNLKNENLIYNRTTAFSEEWGSDVDCIEYLGKFYCDKVIVELKTMVSDIIETKYIGCLNFIANEVFSLATSTQEYNISFKHETFDIHNQLTVTIKPTCEEGTIYDLVLERIKINLKDLLLNDWNICTWISDEQSEFLAVDLYKKIYKCENQIRTLVNDVLTLKLGVNWFNRYEFIKAQRSYEQNSSEFKRTVHSFANINDRLMSTTIETLIGIVKNIKIFENTFDLSEESQIKLHQKIALVDSMNNIDVKKRPSGISEKEYKRALKQIADTHELSAVEVLRKARKQKYDLWNDIFAGLFSQYPEWERVISDFIANRNHVAHNKLIDNAAYEKMKKNISYVSDIFEGASCKFKEEEASHEQMETWDAEQIEQEQNEEYIRDRIREETGVEIRCASEIFDLYTDMLSDFYYKLDNEEYFNYAISISKINSIKEDSGSPQKVFSVLSNVKEDFNFDIYVTFDIAGGHDDDSNMQIYAQNATGIILQEDILYHNGSAHEEFMECVFTPDSESFLDEGRLNEFFDALCLYINDDMNVIKRDIDNAKISYIKDGGDLPVADFPCWNCNQEYISLSDEIFKRGYCINCGEENEIYECRRCGVLHSSDNGNDMFCAHCQSKIDRE